MFMKIILILPFVLLLFSIAAGPFINKKWWEKNYPYVSFLLASIILLYGIFSGHWQNILISLEDYLSFIILLFSLFVISGGIFIGITGTAKPVGNVLFLAFGAVISNILGTTGAAMLLIRPFLNSNSSRFSSFHMVFFIFIVCNVGGLLTPIGDPPLFLGYLKGIPFFWFSENLFVYWIITNLYLLFLFYLIDKRSYAKAGHSSVKSEEKKEEIKYKGILNFIPLVIIICSVFITKPLFLREIIMLATALLSYKITPTFIHKSNEFNFEPIREVAILFFGIFVTMIPALQFLSENSLALGLNNAGSFYWVCGLMTSFLDNAPAFLNFLAVAMANKAYNINVYTDMTKYLSENNLYIVALSVSAVFFGAMTYIGNGPNFMVKSITEKKFPSKKLPGFMGFMLYSLTILLPFYFLLWLLFLHN